MPLYLVRRRLDPTLPKPEADTLALRAIGAAAELPGVRWIRSYVWSEPGAERANCIYEAPSVAVLESHAALCSVPFIEIREVVQVNGDDHVTAVENETPEGASRFLITRTAAPDTTQSELDAALFRSAACVGALNISWERSFWDAPRKQSSCIYLAQSAELIRKHATLARIECDSIQPVTELLPSAFAPIYDAFGLPRHWEHAVESSR